MKYAHIFALVLSLVTITACEPMLSDEAPPLLGSDDKDGGSGGDDDSGGDGSVDPGPSCPGGFRFAISESDSSSSVQRGDLRDGLVKLYLWKLAGTGISALQGEFSIAGGSYSPGSFSSRSPFIGITTADGPDVLVALGGCPCEELLVGSFRVEAGPDGVLVSLSRGSDGGAVSCDASQTAGFQCLPYSSR
jgi:hypothetical protein